MFPKQQPRDLTGMMKLEHCLGFVQSQSQKQSPLAVSVSENLQLWLQKDKLLHGQALRGEPNQGFSPALAGDHAGVGEVWNQSQAKLLCCLAVKGFA